MTTAVLGISTVVVIRTGVRVYEYGALVRAQCETLSLAPTSRFTALDEHEFPVRVPDTTRVELHLAIADGRRLLLLDGGHKVGHVRGVLQFEHMNVFLVETPVLHAGPPCGFEVLVQTRQLGKAVDALFDAVSMLQQAPRLEQAALRAKEIAASAPGLFGKEEEERVDEVLALLPGKVRNAHAYIDAVLI